MKVSDILYIFVFFAVFSSCETSNEDIELLNLCGKKVRTVANDKLLYTKGIIGNLLISQELRGGKGYYGSVLSDSCCSEPELLFKRGHGHNEFSEIVFCEGYENSLLLMDVPLTPKSLTEIPLAGIDSIKDEGNWQKHDMTQMPSLKFTAKNFLSLSDSTILMIGTTFNQIGHIFSIVDYKNNIVSPLKFWPEDKIQIDSLPKQSVYSDDGLIFGNGNSNYLYVCGRERYSFIFTINGENVNVKKNLYMDYPDYSSKDGMNYNVNSGMLKEITSFCDKKNIYILLKEYDREGNPLKKWQPNFFGNIVEIFDWDGNKLKKIQLDHYGQRIMLSCDSKILYLLTDDYDAADSTPIIWAYDINTII